MRTVFLLDRREDKGEHISQNLKMFLQFSDTGMQLSNQFWRSGMGDSIVVQLYLLCAGCS